ncbi:MAG: hypothetical protein EZS28_015999 [Streblomastix strix]|uniref:Protein kinase domain-containing protein n=1 Tax=Streblomastix strix TaxID=222440 RepID=A0A5J4W1Y0_9EUKA|nr:MAG: hypothetical protein EZS28_015999 [Streblomastix strix]
MISWKNKKEIFGEKDLQQSVNLTLEIIAKYPQIPLPSYTLRALMKQILVGINALHSQGLVHRDIKCDNILLHSPHNSGRVYVKISDFGFAKKQVLTHERTYKIGTIPFMAPELFKKPPLYTSKVDIYAAGVVILSDMPNIPRPEEIKDDILWNLLSKMLDFDPIKRITASEALQHPYFTSPVAHTDISPQIDYQKIHSKGQRERIKE